MGMDLKICLVESNINHNFENVKQKSRGGKRPNSGRKKKAVKNVPITIYAHPEVIKNYGGKDNLREFLYSMIAPINIVAKKGEIIIEGPSLRLPEGMAFTKKMMDNIHQKYSQPLPASLDAKLEAELAPVDKLRNMDIEDKIWAIRAEKCPKERDTALGRKSWQLEQEKRIEELKKTLK